MTPTERLVQIKLKVERAEKHVRDFIAGDIAFEESRPYCFVREFNSQAGQYVFRIRQRQNVPPQLGLIAGDAIHCYRSALDQVIWHSIAKAISGEPGHCMFPVFGSDSDYKAQAHTKINGIDSRAVDILDRIKPYKGGNDLLWALHQLDIIDKHRTLLTVDCHIPGNAELVRTSGPPKRGAAEIRYSLPIDGAVIDGCIIGTTTHLLPDEHYQFYLSHAISINEPKIIDPEPVRTLLAQFSGLVQNIVELFVPFL